MNTTPTDPALSPSLPQALVRHLRHELGDLLQTIYATVAILQERLPAQSVLERRILADLRLRAENCKHLLDNVHDVVAPVRLAREPVDLVELTTALVAGASARHPTVQVRAETVDTPPVLADPGRLSQIGRILLEIACEAAKQRVVSRTAPGTAAFEVEWSVTDDGPGVPADEMELLFDPLSKSHSPRWAVGLVLVRKLVQLHNGRIAVDNLAEGGFRVTINLPAERSFS